MNADPLYWADDHTTVDAYFYYPWSAVSGNDPSAWPFSAADDQTTENAYRKSCVLYAYQGNVAPGQAFFFKPQVLSSNVSLEIEVAQEMRDLCTVLGVTFEELRTEGMLDLNAGTLAVDGQATNIQGYLEKIGTWKWRASVIVPAQQVARLRMIVEYKDHTQGKILLREAILDNVTLAVGKSYTCSLLLDKETDPVVITEVATVPWGDGGSFDLDFE